MTLTAWTHAILYSLTFPLSCVSMNSLWHHYHRHSRNSLHQHFLNKYIQHILYKAISALLHSFLLRTNSPLQIRDLRMVRTQAAHYGYWHIMNLILRPLLWQGLQAPQEFSRLSPKAIHYSLPHPGPQLVTILVSLYHKSTTRPPSSYRFLPTEQWVTSTVNCYPLFHPYEIPSSSPM